MIYKRNLPPKEEFALICKEGGGDYWEGDNIITCNISIKRDTDVVKKLIKILRDNKSAFYKPVRIRYTFYEKKSRDDIVEEHEGNEDIDYERGEFKIRLKEKSIGSEFEAWRQFLEEEGIPEEESRKKGLLDKVLKKAEEDLDKWYDKEEDKWAERWGGNLYCENGLDEFGDFVGICEFKAKREDFKPEEYKEIKKELEQLSDKALSDVEDIAYDEEFLKRFDKNG